MAEFEKDRSEDFTWNIEWEKRAKKILLICSTVCCVLGIIIGIVYGVEGGEVLIGCFAGLWFGTGVGGAISLFPTLPYIFMNTMKEEGLGGAVKTTFLGGLIWFLLFLFTGPISLLVRVLRINHRIKKLERGEKLK